MALSLSCGAIAPAISAEEPVSLEGVNTQAQGLAKKFQAKDPERAKAREALKKLGGRAKISAAQNKRLKKLVSVLKEKIRIDDVGYADADAARISVNAKTLKYKISMTAIEEEEQGSAEDIPQTAWEKLTGASQRYTQMYRITASDYVMQGKLDDTEAGEISVQPKVSYELREEAIEGMGSRTWRVILKRTPIEVPSNGQK